MAVIRIKVDGHLAQCVSVEPMATGSAGVDSVIIDRIDGSWDGFGLTAVFKTQTGSVYYAAVENGGAQIPAAALLSERFSLSLLGTKSDGQGGELRMTTNYVSFGIYAGAGGDGTYPDDPTETLYTEIREIAEHAKSVAEGVAATAVTEQQPEAELQSVSHETKCGSGTISYLLLRSAPGPHISSTEISAEQTSFSSLVIAKAPRRLIITRRHLKSQ